MNAFYIYAYLILNRAFKISGMHLFFVNSKGVKCINQKIKSQQFDKFPIVEEKTIDPIDLYIGFDGLKDKYSLIDVQISKSPHLDLANALIKNTKLTHCSYNKRLQNGFLDMRFNQRFKESIYRKILSERIRKIRSESYANVKVVTIEGRYYIIDGKHTAALCCAMGKKVNCSEIMNPLHDPFYVKVYEIMNKSASQFKKNILLLKKVYQHQ